ncbi:CRISPR-associated endoribonuclease Cas6 [Methanothermobacter sp.]|uniref:CRISPR-associated endoribonuclease Cas6 n=1 Tax=Methanothermobacter sp. TaxID=1884223 RepID=UPI0026258CDF|nr:CRISPR-associated endoribonuclease Cas6 [Methanothermobacter sp.]MDI9619141.1 CRISPR-associated endoribonuclease Cas6 [Methanothermobacter sp.]
MSTLHIDITGGIELRIKIELKSDKRPFKIPYNYNHVVSAIIYRRIADIDLASQLHGGKGFKFFTFSQLNIPRRKAFKNFLLSEDGRFYFFISSPNVELIKSLVEGFIDKPEIDFLRGRVNVEYVEFLKPPEFRRNMKFKTLSPIIVKTVKEEDGVLRQWDVNPNDLKFYENLQKNLVRKYSEFHGGYDGDEYLRVIPYQRSIKRKRIMIPKEDAETYHRAYHMKFRIEGDPRLIEFGYDCGFGEKNSMGFGMVVT